MASLFYCLGHKIVCIKLKHTYSLTHLRHPSNLDCDHILYYQRHTLSRLYRAENFGGTSAHQDNMHHSPGDK